MMIVYLFLAISFFFMVFVIGLAISGTISPNDAILLESIIVPIEIIFLAASISEAF